MAAIDLKNCTVKFKDGYSGPGGQGAVNNGAGYAAAATTMTVDGFVGAVANGDTFTVEAETGSPVHTVTAHTETSGNTTSITFTPGIATGGVVDDAEITILPHELEIKVGEGNLTYSEKRQFKYVLDRGELDTIKEEDEQPLEVRLDFTWEELRAADSSDPPTIEEALKKIGNASDWVSSSSDSCEPYSIDIEITNDPPCEDVESEVILLPEFRWEELNHDVRQSQVSVTGKCNVTQATVTRV